MTLRRIAVYLYLVNFALLATHEIDSAYWHEWDLFKIPGGIDLFLILNFLIIIVLLIGFEQVVEWKKHATAYSFLLAFGGIFAFCIHSYLILQGNPEFNTVISILILALLMFGSLAQIVVLFLMNGRKKLD